MWSIKQPHDPEEQIRRVFDDNWRIILSVLYKNVCCGYSLESPRWGDSNEYPQHTHLFLWRNKQNYPLIITKYPSYLFHYWMTVLTRLKDHKLHNAKVLFFLTPFTNKFTDHYSYKHHLDRVKRIWYLSPMRAAKVQQIFSNWQWKPKSKTDALP